jgi:SAM-dependent methyltransferase
MGAMPAEFYDTDYFLGTSDKRGDFSLLELGPKYVDRTQTVVEYFGLEDAKFGTIAEVGCGTAPFYRLTEAEAGLSHMAVVCSDITDSGVLLLDPAERPPFMIENAEDLPYSDSTISGVVAWDVLHHLEHPDRALAEAHRVLKPSGFLHIVCANPESSADPEHEVYKRDKGHTYPPIVTAGYLQEVLGELGFESEGFTRGFEGSDGASQIGLEAMRPAQTDNTGTHLVAFARKI